MLKVNPLEGGVAKLRIDGHDAAITGLPEVNRSSRLHGSQAGSIDCLPPTYSWFILYAFFV